MAKYHIQHVQELGGVEKIIFYQGDNNWSTEYDQRKIYNKKANATADLYDFGGTVVNDSKYIP